METKRNPRTWMRSFFAIWTGQALSLLGSSIAQFALVWWLTTLTGSATVLATATIMAVLPEVLLGPIAGAYVDRNSRRKIMIVADGVVALAALVLVYLSWHGVMQVWHVYVVMLVRAVGGSFHWPAMQASTSLMVPEKHLSRIAGLNQAVRGAMGIAGPPLAALLLAMLPLYGILLVDVATAAMAIVPLFFVDVPQPAVAAPAAGPGAKKVSIWQDVGQGLRYVWRWPGLLILVLGCMLLNFIVSPASSLLPLLVTRHFHGEAFHLAWLEAAWGGGIVAGGLLLGIWGGFRRRIYTALVGLVLLGAGIAAIGLTPGHLFWLAVGASVFAGFMNPLFNGSLFAVMQSTVAPEFQGRVFTVIGSLAAAMMPLGLAIAGPASDQFGIRVWFVVGGVAAVLMGIACFGIPAVVNIERNDKGPVGSIALEPVPVEVSVENKGAL